MKRMERKGVEIAVKAVRADARAYLRFEDLPLAAAGHVVKTEAARVYIRFD